MSLLLFTLLFMTYFANGSASGRTPMAQLQNIQVKCNKDGMKVQLNFDRNFPGIIYSKGHFYDPKCQYIQSKDANSKSFSFHISTGLCGTKGELRDPTPNRDKFFENTIIIQNDPLIQEVWDQARLLRCNWKYSMSKHLRAKPIKVEDPEKVTVYFDSNSVNALMKVQRGTSPFANPATGYIYKGEQASIVIYAEDDTGTIDANVVSCKVKTDTGKVVPLVDSYGCVIDSSLMTPFVKIREPNDITSQLMFYSYIYGFTVGEDVNFEITCELEICNRECLEPCSLRNHRVRRGITETQEPSHNVEISKKYIVITRDLSAEAGCNISKVIAITISSLLGMVALLSSIVCYLIYKTYRLHISKT